MQNPLRQFLVVLLPILVFLAVDAFTEDPSWAIGSALAFVAFQTVLTWRRTRTFDRFVLVDALLIGGLGAASLVTRDDFFFKLKPAIMEGAMVPLLIFMGVAPVRWLKGYLERYSAGMTIPLSVYPLMRKLILIMSGLVALHSGLILYAALYWSRQTWGWVSGPGFFVIFLPLLGWVLYQRRKMRQTAPPPRRRSRFGDIPPGP